MRILLAEDDQNISLIAKMALEKLGGHEVVTAEDGELALELALEEGFDLILLDEMMPKINGLRVCSEYQKQSLAHAPVIFLSAKSQASDIRDFENLALGYIPKPFDPTELCNLIDNLLASNQGSGRPVA